MITYNPLWKNLKKKGVKKIDLVRKYGFSNSFVYTYLKHNKSVNLYYIDRLCELFDLKIEEVVVYIESNKKAVS